MRLLVTADLHLVRAWRHAVLESLAALIGRSKPDALVVAGDLAIPAEAEVALRELRNIFPSGPILVCLGNHDFWVGPSTENGCSTLEEVIERFWNGPADRYGVTLLDQHNAELHDLTVIGAYGHYDLGFRCPDLRYEGTLVTNEDYLVGRPPTTTPLRWRDFSYMPRELDLASVAQEQVRNLQARLRSIPEKRALVVLHTPPFAALLGIPDISTINLEAPSVYTFFRAYLGNEQMGTMLRREKDRILGVVCGHTHREVSPKDLGGFFGVNIGSDYGEPAAYLFETDTSRLTKISGPTDSPVTTEKGILSA